MNLMGDDRTLSVVEPDASVCSGSQRNHNAGSGN